MDGHTARIAFNNKCPDPVGRLAEMIVAASPKDDLYDLCDPESNYGTVFMECISLYQRQHGLNPAVVWAAVAEWRALSTSDAYQWE